MVCFGGVCLGNVFQWLLIAFFAFQLLQRFSGGGGGGLTATFRGPQNESRRRLAQSLGRVAPSESATSLERLKAVIDKYAGPSGPAFFSRSQDRYVLVKFSATWCGPCRQIAPHVDLLRYCYKFLLVSVDIDVADEDLRKHARAVPTFMLFKLAKDSGPVTGMDWLGMRLISTMQGANATAIENLLATHCQQQEDINASS